MTDATTSRHQLKSKHFNNTVEKAFNLLVIFNEGRCTSAGDEIDFFIFAEDLDGVEAGTGGFFFFRFESFAPLSFFPLTIMPSQLLLFAIAFVRRLRVVAAAAPPPVLLTLVSIFNLSL